MKTYTASFDHNRIAVLRNDFNSVNMAYMDEDSILDQIYKNLIFSKSYYEELKF